MFLAHLISAVALMAPFQDVERIVVQHVSADHMLARMAASGETKTPAGTILAMAPEVVIAVDAAANTFIASGPANAIATFRELVTLFDVAPRRISLSIVYSVPRFEIKSSSTVDLANNSKFSASEDAARFSVTVNPRINGDGTITVICTVRQGQTESSVVARAKEGTSWLWTRDRLMQLPSDKYPTEAEIEAARSKNAGSAIKNNPRPEFRVWVSATILPK